MNPSASKLPFMSQTQELNFFQVVIHTFRSEMVWPPAC